MVGKRFVQGWALIGGMILYTLILGVATLSQYTVSVLPTSLEVPSVEPIRQRL